MIFLTGERMNFFLRLGAGILSLFCWNFKIKKVLYFFSIILILISDVIYNTSTNDKKSIKPLLTKFQLLIWRKIIHIGNHGGWASARY